MAKHTLWLEDRCGLARILLFLTVCIFALSSPSFTAAPDGDAPASHLRTIEVDFLTELRPADGSIAIVAKQSDVELASTNPEKVAIDGPGSYQIGLAPDKTWIVSCQGTGLWCPQLKVGAEDKRGSRTLVLPVFQAALITGKIDVAANETVPDSAKVQGWLHVGETNENPVASFRVEVEILEDGRFQWEGPVGRLDLRIAAGDYVPTYRWGLKVQPKTGDLGILKLVRGGSISGFVWDTVTDLPADNATVTLLTPHGVVSMDVRRRLRRGATRTTTNTRGFFQILGAPPGTYRLQVETAERAIRVFGPVEVQLNGETPLSRTIALTGQIRFEVQVDPPEIDGESWAVKLTPRFPSKRDQVELLEFADDSGLAVFSDVSPMDYQVDVQTLDGDVFFKQNRSIEESTSITLDVPIIHIDGTLSLDGNPLGATLVAGSGNRDDATLKSDSEDGSFSGSIRRPDHGVLFIEITSTEPTFRRRIVQKGIKASDNYLSLEIDLVGTDVTGSVMNSSGSPVGNAIVYFSDLESRNDTQVVSDSDGAFTLLAIGEGSFRLWADHDREGDSEEITVELRQGQTPPVFNIVLARRRDVRGVVRAADGSAIPGAEVQVLTTDYAPLLANARTDIHGRFRLRVGASSTQGIVTVFAPSQILWSACRTLPTSEVDLELRLTDLPGATVRISFEGDDTLPPLTHGRPLLISSDGGLYDFSALKRWQSLATSQWEGANDPLTLVVPRMASDISYSAAWSFVPPWQIGSLLCSGASLPEEFEWKYVARGTAEDLQIDVSKLQQQYY